MRSTNWLLKVLLVAISSVSSSVEKPWESGDNVVGTSVDRMIGDVSRGCPMSEDRGSDIVVAVVVVAGCTLGLETIGSKQTLAITITSTVISSTLRKIPSALLTLLLTIASCTWLTLHPADTSVSWSRTLPLVIEMRIISTLPVMAVRFCRKATCSEGVLMYSFASPTKVRSMLLLMMMFSCDALKYTVKLSLALFPLLSMTFN